MCNYKKNLLLRIGVCITLFIIVLVITNNRFNRANSIEDVYTEGLCINEIMTNNKCCYRDDDGDFVNWIELYNSSDERIGLGGLYLSDNSDNRTKWKFPDISIEPKSYQIIYCSGKNKKYTDGTALHTNFKIDKNDSIILLSDNKGRIIDNIKIPDLQYNISYGRKPDGSECFCTFDNGSPEKSNNIFDLVEGTAAKRLCTVEFSVCGGIYEEDIELKLSCSSDANIYYTLDGSEPTNESILYSDKIIINEDKDKATIIRARAIKQGYPSSEVVTNTYFVSESFKNKYNIPIVSLVTDPENLYDYETGIYVGGKIYDEWLENNEPSLGSPANYTQKGKLWERPASIELYNSDYSSIHQDIGIRIQGAYSRANIIKSFRLIASENYDSFNPYFKDFKFNREDNTLYKKLVLRTSGTDYNKAFFRDAFIQGLVKELNILDLQDSMLCVLFLNGEYWGIRNIRENQDDNYLSFKYNIPTEDIVILKNPSQSPGCVIDEGFVGDEFSYCKLYNYIIESENIGDIELENINQMMDLYNYIEYNILQMYICNYDWPANNVAVWRKRTESFKSDVALGHDGRWRWLVFDLDYGFGIFRPIVYEMDMINYAITQIENDDAKNPLWATQMLNRLLQNEYIRNLFINTFADRLNTVYSSENVTNKLLETKALYYPYVEDHIKKWNFHKQRIDKWEEHIDNMIEFARLRPMYVRKHIINNFNLQGSSQIELSVNQGGYIKINSLYIENTDDMKWNGIYFNGIPIALEAIEMKGYEFCGWEGAVNSKSKEITITIDADTSLRAVFIKKSV